MKRFKKDDFPVDKVRRFLEPGPVVLISSFYKGQRGIMTCGWHMMMGYTTVGAYIWSANDSRKVIEKSGQCVINVPTFDLIDAVIAVGNSHSHDDGDGDKFDRLGLTAVEAETVDAPLIAECHASFECEVAGTVKGTGDEVMLLNVKKAHVARSPKYPKTVHYRGDGVFMISGESKSYRRKFKPEMLDS